MTGHDQLLIERQEAVAIITLNDPANGNSLSSPLAGALADFIGQANTDGTLGCIVLTGAGGTFCAGSTEEYRSAPDRLARLFDQLDVPVIAAVGGTATGAGCDLACMCDIRVAAHDAVFEEDFLRLGLASTGGGAWHLPRVVGLPHALEMALTCRPVPAAEAEEWGLVTHVVERDGLIAAAIDIARKVASFPMRSTRLNKRLIRRSLGMSLTECLELSAAYQAIVQNTADQREAVAALNEKRAPRYIGA